MCDHGSNSHVSAVVNWMDGDQVSFFVVMPTSISGSLLADPMVLGSPEYKSPDLALRLAMMFLDERGPVMPLHGQEGYRAMRINANWREAYRHAENTVPFLEACGAGSQVALDLLAPFSVEQVNVVVDRASFDTFFMCAMNEGGYMELLACEMAAAVRERARA